MDKVTRRLCPLSEIRNILMGFGFEPYELSRIEFVQGSDDCIITLKFNE